MITIGGRQQKRSFAQKKRNQIGVVDAMRIQHSATRSLSLHFESSHIHYVFRQFLRQIPISIPSQEKIYLITYLKMNQIYWTFGLLCFCCAVDYRFASSGISINYECRVTSKEPVLMWLWGQFYDDFFRVFFSVEMLLTVNKPASITHYDGIRCNISRLLN